MNPFELLLCGFAVWIIIWFLLLVAFVCAGDPKNKQWTKTQNVLWTIGFKIWPAVLFMLTIGMGLAIIHIIRQ